MSPFRSTAIGLILALTLDEGCTPTMPVRREVVVPLYVPPLKDDASVSDPLAVRFAEGAPAPSGCFAQSRRTGKVACVLGQYGLRSDSGERHLSLLSNSDDGAPDVPVHVQVIGRVVQLAPQSRRELDVLMRDGDFVVLGPPVLVPVGSPQSFRGLTVELRRFEIAPREELAGGTTDLKIIVRTDSGDGEGAAQDALLDERTVLLQNTLSSVACIEPTLAVRQLDPVVVLIERECRLGAGDDAHVVRGAWLCNRDRARCD